MTGTTNVKLIDLSHVIEAGMTTYPGLPGPIVCDYLTREQSRALYTDGTTFEIRKIEMVANTGTYVDAPAHRYEGRTDVADLPLERLANLDTVVVSLDAVDPAVRAIGPEAFAGKDLKGKALLLHTGWSRHFRTPTYLKGHPYLTRPAALALVRAGVAFVGIDSLNIDDTADGSRPAHTLLLGADIPIGEHFTNLGMLPATGARLHAAPARVRAMGTFPVRAYALVQAR
jgi:arylformamidase